MSEESELCRAPWTRSENVAPARGPAHTYSCMSAGRRRRGSGVSGVARPSVSVWESLGDAAGDRVRVTESQSPQRRDLLLHTQSVVSDFTSLYTDRFTVDLRVL
eukprot:2914783-Prymnesium_polylepis.1